MKRIALLLLLPLSVLVSGCAENGTSSSDALKVIFETDIGNDVDDALALDMLYKYVEWGQVDLLAVMINKDAPAPAEYMDIMNTWYGHTDIPVGIVRGGSDDPWGQYAQKVVDLKNEDGTPMFARSRKSYDDLPDAHILYRQILAKQPDHSVVIATVGFSTNLARLLDTPADEYSPLTGKELVAKKVKLLSAMAGNISELEHHEYNVVKDLPAAIKVFAEWPTEIVVSPFEVGRAIKYPGESIENDFTWAPKHPMVEAYKAYLPMPYDRPTWDLTSVLYAVEGDSWFTVSEPGRIHIDEVGSSIFTPCEDGNMKYLMVDEAQSAAILQRFKDIITQKPAALK